MKERLVGAAVLVALAVWLIPWLLDGPEEPAADGPVSLQLPIPQGQAAADVRTEVVDLNARREDPDSTAAASDGLAATAAIGARPARVSAPAEDADAAPSSNGAAAARDGEDDSAARLAEQRASAGAEVPDAEAGAAAVRAATAAAPRAGTSDETPAARRPAEAAPEAAAGDWAIQLGSFGDEENARRLAERVSSYGYEPQISDYRAGGRTMYRVRVGSHETRAGAEAMASSLSAHGFIAQVVTVD